VVTVMPAAGEQLSRISKLFLDRDRLTPDEARARRAAHPVTLLCGEDVAISRTLQLALLTAAQIACRCFPGAVRIAISATARAAPLLMRPASSCSLERALVDILGPSALVETDAAPTSGVAIAFGGTPSDDTALRVTFDGWIALVGPARIVPRLKEREHCALAGVLAAALALSEIFLSFAELRVDAGRRAVGLSLWRPDLPISDPAALGPHVEALPAEAWLLGLGHLGNAYAWAIAALPYLEPQATTFFLCDFDKVEDVNLETGVLFVASNRARFKTRVVSAWLEERGFQTRLVERRFDASFRCGADEPRLAFSGFDSNASRRDLATAKFMRVIDSGLGGTATNFDTISLRTWPNARPADDLWPELPAAEDARRKAHLERVAQQNPGYAAFGSDACGRVLLAGQSIAVPFVGAAASALVVAEALRLLHGGPRFADLKLRLAQPEKVFAQRLGAYQAEDFIGMKACEAIRAAPSR